MRPETRLVFYTRLPKRPHTSTPTDPGRQPVEAISQKSTNGKRARMRGRLGGVRDSRARSLSFRCSGLSTASPHTVGRVSPLATSTRSSVSSSIRPSTTSKVWEMRANSRPFSRQELSLPTHLDMRLLRAATCLRFGARLFPHVPFARNPTIFSTIDGAATVILD